MLKVLKRHSFLDVQTKVPPSVAYPDIGSHPFYSERLQKVEGILGYSFRDKHLLGQALIHPNLIDIMRGYLVEGQDEIRVDPLCLDYERPEFLGDAVLDLVVTEVLYHSL